MDDLIAGSVLVPVSLGEMREDQAPHPAPRGDLARLPRRQVPVLVRQPGVLVEERRLDDQQIDAGGSSMTASHDSIGRTHARTHIIMLTDDLHVRAVNAATGELLHELVLDTTRDCQPTGRPPGPKRKTP